MIIYSKVGFKLFLALESSSKEIAIPLSTWKPPGIAKARFSS